MAANRDRHQLCCMSAHASAFAGDPKQDLGCDQPIRVGFIEFGFIYHQGVGVDADIIAELARRSGCTFEPHQVLRADLWPAIDAGKLDMATSSISTPGREKFVRFVTYFGIKNMLVLPRAVAGAAFSLDAFVAQSEWRVGLVKGFRYGNYYDYHLKSLLGDERVVMIATQEKLFEELRAGRVDGILAPSLHYFYYLTEAERTDLFMLVNGSPAPPTASGLALSRTRFSAGQTDNWMRLIEAMRLDQTLHRLVSRRISKAAAATMIEY